MLIPIQNQYSYLNLARNKDLKLDIAFACNKPSRVLLVDWKGDCFVCDCEAWLPVSVGKITDFDSLDSVWSSATARALQQDIDLKKFSHCAVKNCGVVNNNIFVPEYTVSINIDQSCNLWCPSCRDRKIMITSGPEYETKLAQVNHVVSLLEKFDRPLRIIMSGNGDVMASAIMRPLIHRFRPQPNQRIKLFTNGLLLRKQLQDNPVLEFVDDYLLSIDAGSKTVYEQVRAGGRWETLLDNLDFLRDHARPRGANVSLTFVIQQVNYQDMQNFIDLCHHYQFNGGFTKLQDWGTWQNFSQHDVLGNANHNEHNRALSLLQQIQSQSPHSIVFDAALLALCQS